MYVKIRRKMIQSIRHSHFIINIIHGSLTIETGQMRGIKSIILINDVKMAFKQEYFLKVTSKS